MVHIHALAVHAHGPKLSMRLGGRGPHCFESWLGVEMHHAWNPIFLYLNNDLLSPLLASCFFIFSVVLFFWNTSFISAKCRVHTRRLSSRLMFHLVRGATGPTMVKSVGQSILVRQIPLKISAHFFNTSQYGILKAEILNIARNGVIGVATLQPSSKATCSYCSALCTQILPVVSAMASSARIGVKLGSTHPTRVWYVDLILRYQVAWSATVL